MIRKHSKQRDIILNNLMHRKDHPTADTLYLDVKEEMPSISLSTVYRNLNLLAQSGQILKLNLGDGMDHFDGDTSSHTHFLCTECGAVLDIEMNHKEEILSFVEKNFPGKVTGHVTYFSGVCGNCCKE